MCTMAGKPESVQVLQQMRHDLSEYRVTVRDEAGDAGRALKVVERHLGFVPRVLGSHGKVVSKGEAGAGLCCEWREGIRSEE